MVAEEAQTTQSETGAERNQDFSANNSIQCQQELDHKELEHFMNANLDVILSNEKQEPVMACQDDKSVGGQSLEFSELDYANATLSVQHLQDSLLMETEPKEVVS